VKHLSNRPENIEELSEMEDYIDGLKGPLKTLDECISDMMDYFSVLNKYKYQIEYEMSASQWTVMGMPGKVAQKVQAVRDSNAALKAKQEDEMNADQNKFVTTLVELEQSVAALEQLTDLEQVKEISKTVKDLENELSAAQEKARLFNSRETLFEAELTDYEDLNRVVKMFEPYAGLWQTAFDWTTSYANWVEGPFVDLDAEAIEKLVEKFSLTIAKTTKYFLKQDMQAQADIAQLIKKQVDEFKPEVPMIVSLRNPGMRERHWDAISKELNVKLTPIEDFTTKQILDMNLKESMELIAKIGESAAKEFQIETALNKMEGEWADMILQCKPYRETGTSVLTGIDDINVILDEQITMTQTIMFSAFKGPFEERIDDWNRKLCNVSDVLEVWVAVQRNWLYLQPIFESPDINHQYVLQTVL
jgi:dynein heavy chain